MVSRGRCGTFCPSLRSVLDPDSAQTISLVLPAFLIPAVVVTYLYYRLAYGYLEAGRDLRRMEAVAKSPVFQSFSELLEGIVTVRAFAAEHRFMNQLYTKIDVTNN